VAGWHTCALACAELEEGKLRLYESLPSSGRIGRLESGATGSQIKPVLKVSIRACDAVVRYGRDGFLIPTGGYYREKSGKGRPESAQ
jgi:hypothetical protein